MAQEQQNEFEKFLTSDLFRLKLFGQSNYHWKTISENQALTFRHLSINVDNSLYKWDWQGLTSNLSMSQGQIISTLDDPRFKWDLDTILKERDFNEEFYWNATVQRKWGHVKTVKYLSQSFVYRTGLTHVDYLAPAEFVELDQIDSGIIIKIFKGLKLSEAKKLLKNWPDKDIHKDLMCQHLDISIDEAVMMNWSTKAYCKNDNFTFEDLVWCQEFDLGINWGAATEHKNIKIEQIMDNHKYAWYGFMIKHNPNLKLEHLIKYPHLASIFEIFDNGLENYDADEIFTNPIYRKLLRSKYQKCGLIHQVKNLQTFIDYPNCRCCEHCMLKHPRIPIEWILQNRSSFSGSLDYARNPNLTIMDIKANPQDGHLFAFLCSNTFDCNPKSIRYEILTTRALLVNLINIQDLVALILYYLYPECLHPTLTNIFKLNK